MGHEVLKNTEALNKCAEVLQYIQSAAKQVYTINKFYKKKNPWARQLMHVNKSPKACGGTQKMWLLGLANSTEWGTSGWYDLT